MNNQSIEFNKINDDSTLPEIVRKSFRIPVENSKNVWVVINTKQYPLRDICLDGIGITLEENSAFTIEQILKNCELNLFNVSIKELNGRIVHLSSDLGKELQCGIQWVDMKESAAYQISKLILKMKERFLKDDNISFDSD